MTKTMLIDASHAEETRVVVLDNNRLDDFDIETADKKQIKGNIYLAKVIRVEPSLQAAFVEYGGNRHGFLAFAEIHPDYYQIPVADRQKLLELEAEEARRRVEAEEAEDAREAALETGRPPQVTEIPIADAPPASAGDDTETASGDTEEAAPQPQDAGSADMQDAEPAEPTEGVATDAAAPEQIGGDDGVDGAEEARERRRARALRSYKIQEVIHRRQIILVQVVKEERGSKGAALTTYISLAGRFSVLMPNSPNGGGVSRKITSLADRRRLKEAVSELDVPHGMGMIVRTAGANRPKPEIKRDGEYLLRLWDDIRERTLASIAPALVYEEASLIKRTIRDVYTRDVDQVLIEGEEGFRSARDFMRMLMPTHVKKVQQWSERQPLFARHNVEQMLDQMFQPTVQLKSGGYLVINQTEALVAIDVNSGRSTRERNIEDTALRTNLEAADEVARQLRLRDLAGLIVVDFIDMETRKHNAMVERRLKDALKNDRARIQVGSISHFGLLEMSRQRLRPSLAETMLIPCPHCQGVGHVRSTASTALAVLRAIEDEAAGRAAELLVHLTPDVALYIFNHKRAQLAAIEARFGMQVAFVADGTVPATFKIEKVRTHAASRPQEAPVAAQSAPVVETEEVEAEAEAPDQGDEAEAPVADAAGKAAADDGERRRRRRRRRRGGRREEQPVLPGAEQPDMTEMPAEFAVRLDETLGQDRGRRRAMRDAVPETMTETMTETMPAPVSESDQEAAPKNAQENAQATVAESAQASAPEPEAEPEAAIPASANVVESLPEEAAASAEPQAKPKRRAAATRTPAKTPRPRRTKAKEAASPEPQEPVFTDIADIFEAAERAEAAAPKPARRPRRTRATSAAETASSEPSAGTEAAAAAENGLALAAPEAPAPEAAMAADQAAEAPRGPAVQPVVIGASEAAPAQRKRGWWKRPA
ncbi:ribonuclease E/G [Acidiphilium sp. C61]|jgi:ribonuclease E|uniref:Rne/Rng family ribonuclease n=1 Tax=Acidiphilium sp. C61 TaxID=1671485 RepID=UPI00157BB187|nr:ribonuclease E/G [Acidiphilium sp. C61]